MYFWSIFWVRSISQDFLNSPLFFSVLNHSSFLFLWYSTIFYRITAHANFHTFFESTKLTSVSIHSQNFARAILWTLSICQLIADCSAKKTLKQEVNFLKSSQKGYRRGKKSIMD